MKYINIKAKQNISESELDYVLFQISNMQYSGIKEYKIGDWRKTIEQKGNYIFLFF